MAEDTIKVAFQCRGEMAGDTIKAAFQCREEMAGDTIKAAFQCRGEMAEDTKLLESGSSRLARGGYLASEVTLVV
jgi:hypothetical protein